MAPSRIKKAIGAIKDQTSIGLAKIHGGSSTRSDLTVAIVKATCHEEYPPDEQYVGEIISLTTYSRALVNASIRTIARRLNRTRNWVVALKTLMLVQRLLSNGNHAYELEIFYTTRRGTHFLNMSDFRDASGVLDAWDYSAFVRTYALYLDEQLEFRIQGRRGKHGGYSYNGDEEKYGGDEMKNASVFSRANHLKQILERFLACRPAGAAKHNRVVAMALYHIVKESFQVYNDTMEIMGVLTERFMQLEVPDMVRVYEIFCRLSKQYDELDAFYNWCKTVAIVRFSECPSVEKIPQKKLDMMNDFIRQKSALSQNRMRTRSTEPKPKPIEEAREVKPQEDLFAIKALPWSKEETTDEVNKPKEEKIKTQEEGDLLNLFEDAPSTEDQGDKLALALFDSYPATSAPTNTTLPWEAFKDLSVDWEMALVQSVSLLSNQKVSLPGGFDTLTFDSMYQQGAMAQPVSSSATASASSVALGPDGRPNMLALPPPLATNGGANSLPSSTDPFAASLAIAPPAYVQMSEMENKQRFLVQEQLVWHQYARDGMQEHVGLAKLQQEIPYQHVAGGYRSIW